MTRLWQLLLTLLLATFCSATCCYNHRWMCFGTGVNCDPNCSDGVSKCDLTTEVCLNDGWGGCLDILFATATIIADEAKVTKYQYTTTSTSINSTQTMWITQTTTSTRGTMTVTGPPHGAPQSTATEMEQSTKSSANGAPFLQKRGGIHIQPTSTVTNTITDPSFCQSLPSTAVKQLVDACTTTITTASISLITTSITQTTTLVMNATATTTIQSTPTAAKRGDATVVEPARSLLCVALLGALGLLSFA